MGADEPDTHARQRGFELRRGSGIGGDRRCRGVDDDQLVTGGARDDVFERQPVRWRVDQGAVGEQRSGLRQPRRIPERAHLPARLIP